MPQSATVEETESTRSRPGGIRVLLVDDQQIIGEAVRRMLAPHADIAFEFCKDPGVAVKTALDFRPTVLLQDLVMPGIDGLDLVREYRKEPGTADIPLIVLSSKEEAATKAEAFARGANDYLVKLPDPMEVIARIRYHSRGYVALIERNQAYSALAESQKSLLEEVKRAAEYVTSLLPAPLERPISTQWRFIPSEALGGDCFGYHWIDDDLLALYLLDVCGHGVGPALLSVSAVNMIRSGSVPGADPRDPGRMLMGLNEIFPMAEHNGMFFTLFYGVYSRSKRVIRWSNGGHPPALLMPPSGTLTQLASTGLMIGAATGIDYETLEAPVAPSSRLLIYSDGLFEVRLPDGHMWSLGEFIQAVEKAPADETVDGILARSRALQKNDAFADDASLLEVRFDA